jgi:hypothetical protein
MNKLSSISYDTYLFQIKRVDEMFVIILKMTSLKFIQRTDNTLTKSIKDRQRSIKHTHTTCRRVISSRSTSGTRRVNKLVKLTRMI